MLALMLVAVIVLLFTGIPVAVAIGLPSLVYVIFNDTIPNFTAIQRMVAGANAYALLAIPFFIFAGNLMNESGVTNRIFGFANKLVGHIRGGLGHVNVVASIIFAGMSGAAIADAGGLGAIEIKAMREAKYPESMTIGVTAASSTIGPIIPPSMVAVIYAVVANTSIGRLFAAGIVPGLIMGLSLMLMIWVQAGKRKVQTAPRSSLREIASSFATTFWALLTPGIILGGIFFGIFTPTEAAAMASVYAILLGFVIYRDMDFAGFVRAVRSTVRTTVQIMFIVAAATLFAWILARERVPQIVAAFMLNRVENYYLIFFAINILLILVGAFMETVASINILVPVFLPIMAALGIDPVHFGVVMIFNLMIGVLTPPFGSVLFVLSSVADTPVEKVAKYTFMYLFPLIIVLVALVLFPGLSLWLPNLLFGTR